jgi:putative oxidoreductase
MERRPVAHGAEPRLLFGSLEGFYAGAISLSWPVIRFAVGLNLVIHGWGKVGRTAGPAQLLQKLPEAAQIGAELTFLLMVTELIGGACLALGLFTRVFAAMAAIEMAVLTFYIYWGNGFNWLSRGYEYTLLWGLVLFAIALRGGGPWSLDRRLGREI